MKDWLRYYDSGSSFLTLTYSLVVNSKYFSIYLIFQVFFFFLIFLSQILYCIALSDEVAKDIDVITR